MGRTSHTVDDGRHIVHSLKRLRQTTMLPLTFGGRVTAVGGKTVERRRPPLVEDYVKSPPPATTITGSSPPKACAP